MDLLDVDSASASDQQQVVVHRRLERRWLGSLSVPFSSLYANTRVEGTFRLHSPPVLLGYERTGHHLLHAGGADDGDGGGGGPSSLGSGVHHRHQHGSRDSTYLNLYLTVEPPLAAPEPPRERLDCGEEGDEIVAACDKWRQALEAKFPDRKVSDGSTLGTLGHGSEVQGG